MNERKIVVICMPLGDSIRGDVLTNFLSILNENVNKYDLRLVFSKRFPLDANRNELVEKALEHNPDYLWFIDSDMLVPPNALDNLINTNKDIVGALCFQRKPPYRPVVCVMKNGKYKLLDYIKLNQIIEVDIVGFGCVLVKRNVFDKLKEGGCNTFFQFKNINSDVTEQLNEDMTFCENARKYGFKIYSNTSVICKHFGEIWVDENISYLLLQGRIPKENINTSEYWDSVWESERLETWRTYKEKFDKIIQALNTIDKDKIRIADIGCGVGVLLRRIIKEIPNTEIYGIDISKKAIDLFKRTEPRFQGFVGNFPVINPFKEKYFDVVIATEFIEHVSDEHLHKFLIESKKILKDGGLFICSTPNNCMPKNVCAEHEQDFTEEELNKLLKQYYAKVAIENVKCKTRDKEYDFLLAFCQ
jgi:2-polyprenyl-3-methyl-5-hydroxy-6-metoxy-1,4-benzoquinol methylase